MSYPEFIKKMNGKYYCSLCRPNKHYCSKAYAFQHANTTEHKRRIESMVKIDLEQAGCVEVVEELPKQESEPVNKMDEMLEKFRIYKEEADKLDKMVADRKKELYIEIFGKN